MVVKIRLNVLFAIWTVMLVSIMISCNEKEEVVMDGNTFATLSVGVIDNDGLDLIEEWWMSESENKLTYADYEVLTKHSQSYSEPIRCNHNGKENRYDFAYTPVLDLIEVGDSLSWRFKMYEGDAEELLFEGKCKNDKGRPVPNFGPCLNRNIQWYFRGEALPFDTNVEITLIRTEDGRYTLKQ